MNTEDNDSQLETKESETNAGQDIALDSNPSKWVMFEQFYKLAIPAIITNFLIYFTVLINATFAGQLNDPA